MPIKSIFSKEIGEGVDKFKEFQKGFEKYREQLGKTPSAWGSISKSNKEAEEAFKGMTAALLAQSEVMRREEVSARNIARSSHETALNWRGISSSVKSAFSTIATTLKHDTVLGLLGLGGAIWGLDSLGRSAASGRRASTGLGLGYGDMTAFGLTYGRVLDPGAFLGAVSQGRGNVGSGEASALFALGINPMGGGDTASTSKQALRRIYEMARGTPEHLLGPVLQEGYGLGALGMDVETLRRIKGMSPQEFDKYSGQMGSRSQQLGVDDNTLRKWQDFVTTLDTTGKRIESSLIRGLVGAAGPLEKLSDAAATLVEKFVGSKGFKSMVDTITDGLSTFSDYIGTQDFKDRVRGFIGDLDDVFGAIAKVARLINGKGLGTIDPKIIPGTPAAWIAKQFGYGPDAKRTLPDGTPIIDVMPPGYSAPAGADYLGNTYMHNPGSMMKPGTETLQQYSSDAEGLRAMRDQLVIDIDKMHQDTLRQLVYGNKNWPGYTRTGREQYLAEAMRVTGFGADEKFGSDPATLSRIMEAFTKNEGHPIPRDRIRVIIEDKAGVSPAVQADMLGGSYPSAVP